MLIRFFAFLTLLLFFSCSSERPKGKTEAEILYKEAQELVEAERFILATEKLNQIRTQHSYSYYATPAELMLAEIQFRQESFIESAASFLLFREMHPRHKQLDYIVFMIGEAYFNQLPSTIDRDLESGAEAIKYYTEVRDRFPSSVHARMASEKIEKIANMLRKKDLYIADFYYRTDVYQASRFWYLDILEHHTKEETLDLAKKRIVITSRFMKKYEDCLKYADTYMDDVGKDDQKILESNKKKCQNPKEN